MNHIFENLRKEIEENCVVCGGARIVDFHIVRTLINKAESKWEERNIPKKPLVNKCPTCQELVVYVEKYCPECGQRLNWEGVE